MAMSNRIRTPNPTQPHLPTPTCACQDCALDRLDGCTNPHLCAEEALTRINLIGPKLNPLSPEALHGNFALTPGRKATNVAAKRNNNEILFNPSITCKNNLAECFRVFTGPNSISNLPASCNYTCHVNGLGRMRPL